MNYSKNESIIHSLDYLIERIRNQQDKIHAWLNAYEGSNELPLYSSVDIRDAGFKTAVVDTNIFPAGFNNLCEHGLADSVDFVQKAILKRAPLSRRILIVAEEHTRNTWYLENIRILQKIILNAGFECKIATFLDVQPAFCENAQYIALETAIGLPVNIYCFKKILSRVKSGEESFDLIILNNDLTTGIPDVLKESNIPIYPSIQAGWHSRLKSHHFMHTNELIGEFAHILGVDPWLFSCQYKVADSVNINESADQDKLADMTQELLDSVAQKYREHNINEKPYVFIKSDSGTYGMGVLPIENAGDIKALNRRNRNKLYRGKSSQLIQRFLVQEGVPTIYNIDQEISEACIYQIENNLIGGFYRSHAGKSQRENLNSQGMAFKKMCPHSARYGDCGVHHDVNVFDVYRILARIAGIAAHREILQLESDNKSLFKG